MGYFAFIRSNIAWLLAGFILALNSSFGQTFFISIFAGKIQSYFNLSHGDWGSIYMIGTLASAIVMVWAGTTSDIYRTRSIGVLVLVGLSLSTLLMALNPAVWLLPVIIFLLRFLGQGMLPHISSVSMSRWFVLQRGKALAISNTGYALGEAFLPVLFTILMLTYHWQHLWIIASLFCFLMVPLIWILLQNERTPQSIAEEVISFGLLGKSWSRKEVLTHPLFWLMLPAIIGPSACSTSFFFQQVYFADVKGWTHLQLVALFPLYTLVAIAFNLISGWALDKFGLDRILPFYQIPMVFAFILFYFVSTQMGLAVGLCFLAISAGANSTLPTAFWAEYYGTQFLGTIKALGTAIMVLGSAIGPGMTGLLIDWGFGIEKQYFIFGLYFLFSTLLMYVGIKIYSPDKIVE
ncbi:MAG: MFS transporter [Paracoccaceae bacterium]|nr:MFS transporter [Paracoccaceae bacterium]MDG2247697.1 MFS transporter [Paracoccaceae bacterium]